MNRWSWFAGAEPRGSRGLKIALAASVLVALLLLGLTLWATSAAFGWLGEKAPVAAEIVRGQAPAIARKIDEIAPGAGKAMERWLPGNSPHKNDVAGIDPGGVARFPGFSRVRYVHEGGGHLATFEGRGHFRAVTDHYARAFLEHGWPHQVLYADTREERHEFRSERARFNLSVKASADTVTVTIHETPLAAPAPIRSSPAPE